MEDMFAALDSHKSETLGDRMSNAWEQERRRAEGKGKEPTLLRALVRVFGGEIAGLGALLCVVEFLFRYVVRPINFNYSHLIS